MPVYKVLGDRIKKIRLENNMTQQEFAEALGYTHKSMINKIETGLTDMSFDKVIALILAFDVNAAEFLDLSDAETNKLMDMAHDADKPDWRKIYPLKSRDESVIYIKPTLIASTRNIEVGKYSYYDGQNYITEGNVAVKTNQRVIITFLDEFVSPKRNLKKYVGKISKSDSDLVAKAVEDGRKVDSDEW